MVKRIKFSIDAQGEVSISVEGAVGSECKTMTEPFESILGQVTARELRDSYFETQSTNETSLQSGNDYRGNE